MGMIVITGSAGGIGQAFSIARSGNPAHGMLSWPRLKSPQHSSVLSRRSPQVWNMPLDTAVNTPGGAESVGAYSWNAAELLHPSIPSLRIPHLQCNPME